MKTLPDSQAFILADRNDLTDEEWIALRRKGIGGSDIAGVLGLSKWIHP